jgi:hypothetical protein
MGSNYPGWGYITDAMKAEAKQFQLKSHTAIKSAEDMRAYIGSGIGIVQIGISWNGSMTPDSPVVFAVGLPVAAVVTALFSVDTIPDAEVGQAIIQRLVGIAEELLGYSLGSKAVTPTSIRVQSMRCCGINGLCLSDART